ncbi:hypothetical protein BFL40_10445 [Pseudomonas costantinii]|uniref:Uncharacterized protein n=1 Tax=Pseudomonas costantinii TaxID=168469 RepID=A0A1S2V3Q1_9PSED|nr:hypothetical protein BFL40_10445 [Pseudomonas costantinii]
MIAAFKVTEWMVELKGAGVRSALLLNPIAKYLKHSTAVTRFCVLLNWRTEEAAAFGQAVGLAKVMSADIFELLVDQ